jgi:NodT family efflux transporter outer membrane factor (OMF) lipoprotein
MGPNYQRPEVALPDEFPATSQDEIQGIPDSPAMWWTVFDDPALTELIERAYRQNLTLEAAGVRVVGARIARRLSAYPLFPVDIESGSAAHINFSQTVEPDVEIDPVERGRIGELIAANVRLPDVTVRDSIEVYDVGFDGLWEPDLWGRVRRGMEGASANLAALEGDYDAILVSLTGEVAATHIQIRTLDRRIAVAQDNLEAIELALDSAEERLESDEAVGTDVHLLRSLLTDTQATIPALVSARQQSVSALCLLLGEPPSDLGDILGDGEGIPVAPMEVPIGAPADLLRRRPDVRAAERRAAAECARIGAIQARMLPSFTLFGGLGLATSDIDNLFDRASVRGAYGAGFQWSLLLIPAIQDMARIQDTEYQAALLTYQETVLRAAAEVEGAANRFAAAHQRVPLLCESAEEAQRAVETALEDYSDGEIDAASLVLALQGTVVQRDRLAEAQGEVARSLVATYKALGGGWEIRGDDEVIDPATYDELRSHINWWFFNPGAVRMSP